MRYFLLILAILLAPQAKAADVFDASVSLGGSSVDSYYDDGTLATWIELNTGEVGIGTNDPVSLLHLLFGTTLGVAQPTGTMLTVESNSVSPYLHVLGAAGGGLMIGDSSDYQYYDMFWDTSSGEMTWTRDSELYLTWNSGVFELNSAASDVNFNVRGDTDNNLLFTDAGNDVVIFGSGTALAGCKVQFEDNACILDTATVSTTDATQTTLQTVAIPTDTAVYLNTKILARRTGGTSGTAGDSAVYEYTGRVKDVGGTVTIPTLFPQADFVSEDQDWSIIWAVDGTSIDIDVIGAADNDITWEVTTYYQEL